MRYEQTNKQRSEIFYCVTEGGKQVAEFSYHIDDRFWLDMLRLSDNFVSSGRLDAILQFLQYKCWREGENAIYLRISWKNLLYMEMYKKFGFYVIAQERRPVRQSMPAELSAEAAAVRNDVYTYEYVMKYCLPRSLEEAYSQYIRRK